MHPSRNDLSRAIQRQVLALEGVPTEMPYISPAPAQPKTAENSEEGEAGDDRAETGSGTARSDDMRVRDRQNELSPALTRKTLRLKSTISLNFSEICLG